MCTPRVSLKSNESLKGGKPNKVRINYIYKMIMKYLPAHIYKQHIEEKEQEVLKSCLLSTPLNKHYVVINFFKDENPSK